MTIFQGIRRFFNMTGLILSLFLYAMIGCTPSRDAIGSDTKESAEPTMPSSESDVTQAETGEGYADIGQGSFCLTQDTYYLVVGGTLKVKGQFDFDEPDEVPLTPRVDEEGVVTVSEDGTITAQKAGDYTLTVREEKYGTEATATLHVVGNLRDNIIVSVPIWRDKWVNAEHFAYMKDAGVDMVVAVSGIETADYSMSAHMLKTALGTWSGGEGLRVLVHSTKGMMENILDDSDQELSRLVARFEDEPALAGYHLIDEPVDPSLYTAVQRKLGILDPDALTDVNFLPAGAYASLTDYELRMDDYCKLLGEESVAYLSFDNYPFGPTAGTVNEGDLFGNFEACRRAGLRNDVPTAFYIQAVGGYGNSYRRPDEGVMTYHMSSALAYGFKWIKYWSWFVPDYGVNPEKTTYDDYTDAIIGKDGKPTDLYPVAKELHKRAHTIGPILVDCDAVEVYHTGARSINDVYQKLPQSFFAQTSSSRDYAILSLLCNEESGEQYLMVVNKNFIAPADMTLTLRGVESVIAIDSRTGEGTEIHLTDGILPVSLAAGDFAFFKLPEGDFRTPVAKSENLSQNAAKVTANLSQGSNGFFISCALDGQRTSTSDRQGWRVAAGQTGEMILRYDSTVTLNRIDLYPTGQGVTFGAHFPHRIKVSVASYENPDAWQTVYEADGVSRPTTEVPVLRFDEVSADLIKLEISGGLLPAELCEVEIYHDDGSIPAPLPTSYEEPKAEKGKNYALGKTAIASGSAYESVAEGWGLSYLTDGNKLLTSQNGGTNGWMSQGMAQAHCSTDACWGGVDLGAVYTINEVHVYPRQNGGYFPQSYEIQVSIDGKTYKTVASVSNDTETGGVGRFIKLDGDCEARFVRVVARVLRGPREANLGGYLMQLSEIEVYWN